MRKGKITPAEVAVACKLSRAGKTWKEIGKKLGRGEQVVRRAVLAVDPALKFSGGEGNERAEKGQCVVCERKLVEGARRYCPERVRDCRLAVRTLREVTVWRPRHIEVVARAEGRKPRKHWHDRTQLLHKNTKTYRILHKHGMVELLPAHIEIR